MEALPASITAAPHGLIWTGFLRHPLGIHGPGLVVLTWILLLIGALWLTGPDLSVGHQTLVMVLVSALYPPVAALTLVPLIRRLEGTPVELEVDLATLRLVLRRGGRRRVWPLAEAPLVHDLDGVRLGAIGLRMDRAAARCIAGCVAEPAPPDPRPPPPDLQRIRSRRSQQRGEGDPIPSG